MKETCDACGKKTQSTRPAKFSPEDKWGEYRRAYKKEHNLYKETVLSPQK